MDIKNLKINIQLHSGRYLVFKQKRQYKEAMIELEKIIIILYQVMDYSEKSITKFLNYFAKNKINHTKLLTSEIESSNREEYIGDFTFITKDEKGNILIRKKHE